jgi:S-adenosyl methyltransferase
MATEPEESAPPGIDISRPHSARMYDYYLGGYFVNIQVAHAG